MSDTPDNPSSPNVSPVPPDATPPGSPANTPDDDLGDAAIGDTLKDKVKQLPFQPGVYLMKDDRDRVLYVGKAKELRKRVGSYFSRQHPDDPKTRVLVSQIRDIDYIPTDSEVDALVLEARLVKDLQPKYNIDLKDGKSFPYLAVTHHEDFPIVFVTRDRSRKHTTYYGPFTDAVGLRAAVKMLQKVFLFRTCMMGIVEGDPKLQYQRPCLLYYIKQCSAPCAGRISASAYQQDMQRFRKFLIGKRKAITRELEVNMKKASAELRFETAAAYRDQLRAIAALSKRPLLGEVFALQPTRTDYSQASDELQRVLGMEIAPRTIEGFDIAHLQGEATVAGLVAFVDGQPFKSGYRRYKIKTVEGIDDFASLQEVVSRRFTRMDEEGEMFPDILLIDGGKGQLSSVMQAFQNIGIDPPQLVSIAKKEEILFTPEHMDGIALPRNNIALQLLQQVRDEAHRFAQHYHHLLRDKKRMPE